MFPINSAADIQQRASLCLRYLRQRQRASQGVDSVDVTLVLGQLGLLGATEEIPGLRGKVGNRQWLRVAHSLQATLSQLQSFHQAGLNTQDNPLSPADVEILFQTTVTVLGSLVEYCRELAVAQRRQRGRDNTRRYRNRRRST